MSIKKKLAFVAAMAFAAALMVPAMAFAADGEIKRIDIGGLSYPVEGAVPGKAVTIEQAGVSVVDDETFWLRYNSETGDLVEKYTDDTWVDGNPARAEESYVMQLSLEAASGHAFGDGLKIYCNGLEVPVYTASTFPSSISPLASYAGLFSDGSLLVSLGAAVLAPESPSETIDRVDIGGIGVPKAGVSPSKEMTLEPTDLKVDVDETFWVRFEQATKEMHDTYEDTGKHVDNEPFREGVTYFLKVQLTPADGHSFDPAVKMYYNDEEIAMLSLGDEPDFSKSFAMTSSNGSSLTAYIFAGETEAAGGSDDPEGGDTPSEPGDSDDPEGDDPDDNGGNEGGATDSEPEGDSSKEPAAGGSDGRPGLAQTGDATPIVCLIVAAVAAGIAALVARRKFA